MCPCCWPPTAAAWPSGTGTRSWEPFSSGLPPRELVGRLAHLAGLIPEAAPVSPEELVPLFAWEKLPRRDIAMEPW